VISRVAILTCALALGCGRVNFDPVGGGGDDAPGGGDGGPPGDGSGSGAIDAAGPGVMCLGTATPNCPVTAGTLSLGGTHNSSGPSDMRGNGFSGTCGGGSGQEQTIQFLVQQSGTYIFTTANSTFDTVLYIRDDNCMGPELGCSDNVGALFTSEITLSLIAGQRVVAFVDSANGLCGNYSLRAGVSP